MKRALKALEYYKIREMLAACCVSAPGRELAGNMLPLDDCKLVQDALEETGCAESIILKKRLKPYRAL